MHYTLCDLFADLTQNAIEADSSKVEIEFTESDIDLVVYIRDNGKGMSPDDLKRVWDPFYTNGVKHPKRKVGLGIPFLIQTATTCGGDWNIESELGTGTTVFCSFDLTNIDTPPIGDVCSYFRNILMYSGSYEMIITRKKTIKTRIHEYIITRSDVYEALGSFEDASSLALLGEYLQSQENEKE